MIAITIPPHNGDVTHHHDHFATTPIPANLKIRNTRNTNPSNPIPVEDDDLFAIFFNKLSYLFVIVFSVGISVLFGLFSF